MNGALRAASVLAACTALACDPQVVIGHALPSTVVDAALDDGSVPAMDAASDSGDGNDASIDSGSFTPDASDTDAALPPPEITWLSGAHPGNDLQQYLDFGTWRGRPLDVATLYPDRLTGWPGIVNPVWPVDMFDTFPGVLVLNEPLYPEGQGNNADCAAGLYDTEWQKLGTFLVARNRPDTIIRLGWGLNDAEHPWRADADPSDWVACFRHVVDALRTTAPQIRIDWSWNSAGAPEVTSIDPFSAYPGDAYVDFIGVEVFDDYPPTRDAAAWQAKCNAPTGLCSVIDFARSHGKQVGIAEWGVVSCGATTSADMGGDNPLFIRSVVETFAQNADVMAYEAYFEDGGDDVCSAISGGTMNVNAAAEYVELYRL